MIFFSMIQIKLIEIRSLAPCEALTHFECAKKFSARFLAFNMKIPRIDKKKDL